MPQSARTNHAGAAWQTPSPQSNSANKVRFRISIHQLVPFSSAVSAGGLKPCCERRLPSEYSYSLSINHSNLIKGAFHHHNELLWYTEGSWIYKICRQRFDGPDQFVSRILLYWDRRKGEYQLRINAERPRQKSGSSTILGINRSSKKQVQLFTSKHQKISSLNT